MPQDPQSYDPRTMNVDDLPPEALSFRYLRARGPGGQHVNKVATAVELRLDLSRAGLPATLRRRLVELAGRRATEAGDIVIFADESRSQLRNREAALERLGALLEQAGRARKRRIPTRPSKAAKARRAAAKARRSETKRLRRAPPTE